MIERVKIPEIHGSKVTFGQATNAEMLKITEKHGALISLADKFFGIFKMKRVDKFEEPESMPDIRAWSNAECIRLEEEYPIRKSHELMKMFNRSYKSINTKAHKMGLKKK